MLLSGEKVDLPAPVESFKMMGMTQGYSLSQNRMLMLDTHFKYICWNPETQDLISHGQIKGENGENAGPVPAYTPWISLSKNQEMLGFLGSQAKKVFRYNIMTNTLTQCHKLLIPPLPQSASGFSRFDARTDQMLSVYFKTSNSIELVVSSPSEGLKRLGSVQTSEGQLMITNCGTNGWAFCFQNPSANLCNLFFANCRTFGKINLPLPGIPCGLLASRHPHQLGDSDHKQTLSMYYNQSASDNESPGVVACELDLSKTETEQFNCGDTLDPDFYLSVTFSPSPTEPRVVRTFLPEAIFDEVFQEILIRTFDQKLCRVKLFGPSKHLAPHLVGCEPFPQETGWFTTISSEQRAFWKYKTNRTTNSTSVTKISPPDVRVFTFWMLGKAVPHLSIDARLQTLNLLKESGVF